MSHLLHLAQTGGTVVFVNRLPRDVAGWAHLDYRRRAFQAMKTTARRIAAGEVECRGRILIGPLSSTLPMTGIARERLGDTPDLMCVRRALPEGRYYFVANRGEQTVDGWVPLATGTFRLARTRHVATGEILVVRPDE